MQKIGLLTIFIVLGLFSSAFSQEDQTKQLLAAKSLKCTFGIGGTGAWKNGKLTYEKNSFNTTLHFDSIALKNKTGRVIGNQGSADVVVLLSGAGITFIEMTATGNPIFTTIFASLNKEKNFIAVTSRHIDMPGGPISSQYHGSCKTWD